MALQDFVRHQECLAGLLDALHSPLEGHADWLRTLQDAYQSFGVASAIYYRAATGTAVELPLARKMVPVRDGWGPRLPTGAAPGY